MIPEQPPTYNNLSSWGYYAGDMSEKESNWKSMWEMAPEERKRMKILLLLRERG
jgi:hypothetical protein